MGSHDGDGDGLDVTASARNIAAAMRYLQAQYGSASVSGLAYARNMTGHGEHVISPTDPAAEPELAVVPGSVTGYRWWTLPAPDWTQLPSGAGQHWPHGRLHGVQGDWHPGVNTASCNSGYGYARDGIAYPHQAPVKGCGCGFWAYWQPEQRSMHGGDETVLVFGVIRAWGRVRLATRGFRAEKARIMAVHLPFTLLPEEVRAAFPRTGWHDAFAPVPEPAFDVVTLRDGRRLQVPPGADPGRVQAAVDYAEAWAAVVGDRMETDYGVRVFETRDALLACFPPDPVHGSRACQWCGTDIIAGTHARVCPDWAAVPGGRGGPVARGGPGSASSVHFAGGGSLAPGGSAGGSGGSGSVHVTAPGGGGGGSWAAPGNVTYGSAGGASSPSRGLAQWLGRGLPPK